MDFVPERNEGNCILKHHEAISNFFFLLFKSLAGEQTVFVVIGREDVPRKDGLTHKREESLSSVWFSTAVFVFDGPKEPEHNSSPVDCFSTLPALRSHQPNCLSWNTFAVPRKVVSPGQENVQRVSPLRGGRTLSLVFFFFCNRPT